MIEKIWDAFPTPVNPREAPWETYPRRGRKGGRRRVQKTRVEGIGQGNRESGAKDPARGPPYLRNAVPP